ncbi:hypothetical protein [Saccharopolyspora erythraea]|uniref:Uncharacterized protein n=2 Tax=Saccharopolyspora erythraea TaxID=1836 RepID=A4FI30_SACEN|nr:hypothetical protein [Saccharopolyspora erythraea]QRK87569.1 hypothetical protein JQX30_22600 [Saccharopolyspora erythraea]CAM03705.1 hypothetical protein SACE_4436 [Saccharopolyspora erythraea NRRL 2338]
MSARRCWLAGEAASAPADHPHVTDNHARTWVHLSGELYREESSGQRCTFTELVSRTDLVETA